MENDILDVIFIDGFTCKIVIRDEQWYIDIYQNNALVNSRCLTNQELELIKINSRPGDYSIGQQG